MSTIPTDLFREILIRLEADALVRFCGVCKSWNELIKSPAFIKDHLTRVAASNSLHSRHIIAQAFIKEQLEEQLIKERASTPGHSPYIMAPHLFPFTSIRFSSADGLEKAKLKKFTYPNSDGTRVVGSCNGIVCLQPTQYGNRGGFILWNPSTGICRKVDDNPDPIKTFHDSHCYFGYSAGKDEYYVLRVSWRSLEVYNLNKDSWTTHSLPTGLSYMDNSGPSGVVFHDVLYLIMRTFGHLSSQQLIMSFDLSSNSFGQHEPPPQNYPECSMMLDELQGSLCVFGFHSQEHRHCVWAMETDGGRESWRRISFEGSEYGLKNVLQLLPNTLEDEDDTHQVVGIFMDGIIRCCDFKNNRATPVHVEGQLLRVLSDMRHPCVCLGTLVSPFLL